MGMHADCGHGIIMATSMAQLYMHAMTTPVMPGAHIHMGCLASQCQASVAFSLLTRVRNLWVPASVLAATLACGAAATGSHQTPIRGDHIIVIIKRATPAPWSQRPKNAPPHVSALHVHIGGCSWTTVTSAASVGSRGRQRFFA